MAIARSDRGLGPGCPERRVTVLRKWAVQPTLAAKYSQIIESAPEYEGYPWWNDNVWVTERGRKALAEEKGAKNGK